MRVQYRGKPRFIYWYLAEWRSDGWTVSGGRRCAEGSSVRTLVRRLSLGGWMAKKYTINPPCCVLRHPFWEDRSSLTEFSWDGLWWAIRAACSVHSLLPKDHRNHNDTIRIHPANSTQTLRLPCLHLGTPKNCSALDWKEAHGTLAILGMEAHGLTAKPSKFGTDISLSIYIYISPEEWLHTFNGC